MLISPTFLCLMSSTSFVFLCRYFWTYLHGCPKISIRASCNETSGPLFQYLLGKRWPGKEYDRLLSPTCAGNEFTHHASRAYLGCTHIQSRACVFCYQLWQQDLEWACSLVTALSRPQSTLLEKWKRKGIRYQEARSSWQFFRKCAGIALQGIPPLGPCSHIKEAAWVVSNPLLMPEMS